MCLIFFNQTLDKSTDFIGIQKKVIFKKILYVRSAAADKAEFFTL